MSSATTRSVFERLGHVAGHDALGQPLDDGGLAHARLADQHRIVLGPPRQHLHHAPDLLVPADHRVELALPGELGQVPAVALQGLVLVLGVLVGDPLGAADLLQHLEKPVPRDARLRQNPAGLPAFLAEKGHKNMLNADVLILHLAGFGKSGLQQGFAAVRKIALPHAGPADLRKALDGAPCFRGDPLG